MKKRVLLTGGSGFIGRNLSESVFANKFELVAPRHAQLELMDEDAVRNFVKREHIDIIVHAAAKPGHRNAKDSSGICFTNTRIFFNLARNIDLVEKIIITGSGAVYDNRHYLPKMPEDYFDTHVPADEHGLSKYVMEQYIRNVDRIIDLRIFGIYGKYEDYAIRFISNMICKALFDLPLTMKQDRKFDYLWVGDLEPILSHVIENEIPWHSLNITPDTSVSLSSIAKNVLQIMGKELPLTIALEGLGSEYSGDNTRLRSILPNLSFTSIESGISKLVEWYTSIKNELDINLLMVDK